MKKIICISITILFFYLGNTQNEVRVKINTSQNDGTEYLGAGFLFATSMDFLGLGEQSGGTLVGVHFEEVRIPKEAKIDSAFVQFSSNEISNYDEEVLVNIELKANSEAFPAGGASILTSRRKSDNWLEWNIKGLWNRNERSISQRSPDLKELVSEVIQFSEWDSGNPLTFFFSAQRQASIGLVSYDSGLEEHYPELIIYYSLASSATENEILPESISISPNPFSEQLFIRQNGAFTKKMNLILFNSLGEIVLERDVNGEQSFNFNFLNKGLYFVQIKSGSEVLKTEKLIKM